MLSETLVRIGHFSLHHEIDSVCLSGDGCRLVVTFDRGIKIVRANTGSEIVSVAGIFLDAWFDANGKTLWVVRKVSSHLIVAEVRSADTLSLLHEVDIVDPHFSSGWFFYPSPAANSVVLWAAAGQDGQTSFWLQFVSSGIEIRANLPADTTPPSFSEDASEFLVCNDDEIRRCEALEGNTLGVLKTGSRRAFSYEIHYLTKNVALASIGEGLLRLLDVEAMCLGQSVEVQGHEPRKTSELYPSLEDDEELVSSLCGIYRQGEEHFLSSHLVLPGEVSNQKHVVLRWRNPLRSLR